MIKYYRNTHNVGKKNSFTNSFVPELMKLLPKIFLSNVKTRNKEKQRKVVSRGNIIALLCPQKQILSNSYFSLYYFILNDERTCFIV